MRSQQFQTIVLKTRRLSYRATSAALGQNEEEHIKELVNQYYEFFYFDHNWPFLKVLDADIAITAGEYEYDVPESIDLERIEKVDVLFGDIWQPVDRGITMDEYNQMSPEDNERFDPVLKYDIQWTGSAAQIAVWPKPASATTLRLQGRKKFERLVTNTDICLLDDALIAGYAAADLLLGDEDPRAQNTLARSQKHYNTLKFGLNKNRNSKFSLRGQPPQKDYSNIEIRVAQIAEE